MSIFVILAIAFPTTQVAYAVSSPFVGNWEATDADGSDIRLTISGAPSGPFQITSTDSYISFCDGESGIIRGTGQLNQSDPYLLEAELHLKCFTTGASLDYRDVLRYHPNTNTLSSRYENRVVTIWHRAGRPPASPPPLYLRVNYGHDWVESFYEGEHTVWVTVTDGDGNVKGTAEVMTDPNGYFQTPWSDWLDADGNPMEYPPDIRPNDWVYGWVDNGASAQVQIGDIIGTIDLEADSIEGTVSAPWYSEEVGIECHSWGAPLPEEILKYDSVQPDGEDTYSCSWPGEWDIQPGQDVGVAYFGPDGHWVANAFHVPPLMLYINYDGNPDVVEGSYELGHSVHVTVLDSAGVIKATASVTTIEMQHWGGEPGFRVEQWDGSDGPPDIQPGDVVRAVVDNGLLTTETRIGEITATVDVASNSISGTVDAEWAGDLVTIVCMPWGGPEGAGEKHTTVAPDGSSEFVCTWDSSEWDIQPGETIGVAYIGDDVHFISRGFLMPVVISVAETSDVINGDDGVCTLREAIIAANTNSPSGEQGGECPAGSDFAVDTIVLAADQTYSLTIDSTYENDSLDGDLDVGDNSAALDLIIMVEGDGSATIAQDASVDDRVLENHGATVQIEGLTLTGGNEGGNGGGVLNHGTLDMTASEVSGNVANYGGGLFNELNATLNLAGSTVTDNTANVDGGGLWNLGTLNVDASVVAANTARYNGGGLFNYQGTAIIQNGSVMGGDPGAGEGNTANLGGGFTIWSGSLTLTDSTVSDNSVSWDGGGGRIMNEGTLTVNGSTISNNSAVNAGGGLQNHGALIVENSEISDNTASNGGGIGNDGSSLTLTESTITGNLASWDGGGLLNWPAGTVIINMGGIAGNSATHAGGGLLNYGTLTIKSTTVSGNIASDNGGGIANLGQLVVDSGTITANSGYGGGGLANWPNGTVAIQNGSVVGGNPNAGEGNIATGTGGGGIVNFGSLTLDSSKILGNHAPYGGGLDNWSGVMTVTNSLVSGNSASASGGGLINTDGGSITIENGSLIMDNSAPSAGGIANWENSAVVIKNSTVSNNTATYYGGGMASWGMLTIGASSILGNSANDGGGLTIWNGTVTLEDSIVADNNAAWGGGIDIWGGTLTLDSTTVSGNTASNGDGGIQIKEGATVVIQNASFVTGNTAPWGGGISNWGGTLTIDASTISNNSATESGGGILNKDGGTTTIQNGSVVSGNAAKYEGGISNWAGSTLTIEASLIADNTASGSSGGIGNLGTMTLNTSTVSRNSAPWGGGLFNAPGSVMTVSNSTISENTASGGAAGFLNVNGTLNVAKSVILANTSPGEGDAVYSATDTVNATTVSESCIAGNGTTAVFNERPASQNFTGNWWGSDSGPTHWSNPGGTGDSVSDYVDFSSWLSEPLSICAP